MQFTVHCTRTGRVVSNSLVAVLLISEMHRDCMVYSFSYQTKCLLKVNATYCKHFKKCHWIKFLLVYGPLWLIVFCQSTKTGEI